MSRPTLEPKLAVEQFRRWYWLKSELVAFCRAVRLSTVGTKPELAQRIEAYLSGKPVPEAQKVSRRVGTMPTTFTPDTVIGEGWRCNQGLGVFFKSVCGPGFRFNAAVRQVIHEGKGRPLSEAIAAYKHSILPNSPKQPIIAQNQYNQHTRDFFVRYPNATRAQCIADWKRKRQQGEV
jgi:hypothetical protein